MNILITGGAGFIGAQLTRRLLAQGHAITILDNFLQQVHGESKNVPAALQSHVRLVRGDVADSAAMASAMQGAECLVHLAAETGTGQSMYEVARYHQTNLTGTASLCDLLMKGSGHSLRRLVVASSRAIYGEGAYQCLAHGLVYPSSRPVDDKANGLFDPLCPACHGSCGSIPTPESAPYRPSSFYGLTKQVQEQMVLMFGQVLGIPSVALRYQNVFGPGQSLQNPYTGILAIFSNLAREHRTIHVFEDGKESRDFVYVDDVVDATCASIESPLSGCHVLNVGSGERTTVLEVANQVNMFYGMPSEIRVTGAFREGDIRHGIADLTRIRATLNYKPGWRFNEGLRRFLEWAAETESVPTDSRYERSLAEMQQRGLLHGK
jgi:dTDP-L-rhamnose 4-epimerase